MNREPKPLVFEEFNENQFLAELRPTAQVSYLQKYLSKSGLNAKRIIREPYYFDRDFLSEFEHFYSTSSHEYQNVCGRIHLFDSDKVNEQLFNKALKNDSKALRQFQNSYLGFIVCRPLDHAPLGRTVLKWHRDAHPNAKRVTKTARKYNVHLFGIDLFVEGLAWQQQDEGVSACATIALWTMLHSSALDDYHQIPTTAEITISAHDNYSEGKNPFPSEGLTSYQICDSIIHYGLRPALFNGDGSSDCDQIDWKRPFSRRMFSHLCGSFLRTGYPILLVGKQFIKEGEDTNRFDHTLCIVGFRENIKPKKRAKGPILFDEDIQYIYVHDDNLGPNVRFEISEDPIYDNATVLSPSAPSREGRPEVFDRFVKFIPHQLIVAVNKELRIDPKKLYIKAFLIASQLEYIWKSITKDKQAVTFGIQFFRVTDYLGNELLSLIGKNAKLNKARRFISEKIPPLSLHIGVIRVGIGGVAIFDILCDTSQSEPIPYGVLCLHSSFRQIIIGIEEELQIELGAIADIFLN